MSRTFSVKAMARSLRRRKGVEARAGDGSAQRRSADALDRYIYDNLYIPIVRDGVIPIRDLDIARLTDDEFEKLEQALDHCSTPEYVRLGFVFESLPPAAAQKQAFI
jgi:hypothetical protein